MRRECVPVGEHIVPLTVGNLVVDCARLPRRAAETIDDYRASVAAAEAALFAAHEDAVGKHTAGA